MTSTQQNSPRSLYLMAGLAVAIVVISVAAVVVINRSSSSTNVKAAEAGVDSAKAFEALSAGLESAARYVNADKLEEADALLAGLASRFPEEPLVWSQYYELRLHQGRTEDAYKMMQRLIDLGEGEDFGLRLNAGIVASQIGNIADAINHLQTATRIEPGDKQAPLYLANLYRKVHDLPAAKECLLRVIVLDDSIHQAWGGLAQIAFLENQLDMAQQHLEKARKLEPGFPTWIILQAKVHRRRGQPDQAITLLTSLPEAHRWQQEVVDEIAQSWGLLSNPLKAANEHVAHLDRHPDAWTSATAAARFFIIAEDLDSARSWATYARRLKPDEPEVRSLIERLEL